MVPGASVGFSELPKTERFGTTFSVPINQTLHSRLARIQVLYKQCSCCLPSQPPPPSPPQRLNRMENAVIPGVSQLPAHPRQTRTAGGWTGTWKPVCTSVLYPARYLAYCNMTTAFALTPPGHLDLPTIVIHQVPCSTSPIMHNGPERGWARRFELLTT